jgi:hypothetical protein
MLGRYYPEAETTPPGERFPGLPVDAEVKEKA